MHSVRSPSHRAPESETPGHRAGSFEGRASCRDSTTPEMESNIRHRNSVEEATARPQHNRGKLRPRSLYKPERFTSLVHPTHHDETPGILSAQRRHSYLSAGGSDVQNHSASTHFVTGTKGDTPAIHIDSRPAMSSSAALPARQHSPRPRSGPLAADERSTSPRTNPQMTSSARGADKPSFRRSWSSHGAQGPLQEAIGRRAHRQVVHRHAPCEPCGTATPPPTHHLQ